MIRPVLACCLFVMVLTSCGGGGDAGREPKGPLTFGETYEWDDGLSVKIFDPVDVKPGKHDGIDDPQDHYLKFGVEVRNKTGKAYDSSIFTILLKSGGEDMQEVIGADTVLLPDGIAKGARVNVAVVYGVADPNDIVMRIEPDMDRQAAEFVD